MPTYSGSCFCRAIRYELTLASPDNARSSLCHCHNCKVTPQHKRNPIYKYLPIVLRSDRIRTQKAYGTNYGLAAKVPKDALRITAGTLREHVADNGSGVLVHREFCGTCGSFILEYAVRLSFFSFCSL